MLLCHREEAASVTGTSLNASPMQRDWPNWAEQETGEQWPNLDFNNGYSQIKGIGFMCFADWFKYSFLF